MPLKIVGKGSNIVKCDAIVRLVRERCQQVEEIVISKSTNSQCNYFLDYAKISWTNDEFENQRLLNHFYIKSILVAIENKFESIAIPLIKIGSYEYSIVDVLKMVTNTIKKILDKNEIEVYLIAELDKNAWESNYFYRKIKNFVDREGKAYYNQHMCMSLMHQAKGCFLLESDDLLDQKLFTEDYQDISDILDNASDSFAVKLMKLIDKKGMTDVECYKKGNISKQTWYKILNDKNYRPSKNTVIAFAISLKLNYEETQDLLQSVGFTISNSIRSDLIVKYFIDHKKYDIFELDQALFALGEPTLSLIYR